MGENGRPRDAGSDDPRPGIWLRFQPKVTLASGLVEGVEALVRWRTVSGETFPPAIVLPAIARAGKMYGFTMQVLKEAVHACASFHERGLLVGVAVNVPPSIVVDERLPLAVDAMLVSAGLAPHWLTLELTEGSALPDFEKARFVLDVLAEMRVRLSLDDFGTGYAFVEELHQLPFDEVKIDRSFVGRAVTSPEAAAIVRFTIQLSHALGKRIVAEGVESAETVHLLHRLGADAIQGFVVSPPIDATELLDTFGDISARARELVETRARTITLDRAGG